MAEDGKLTLLPGATGLDALATRVHHDLAILDYPREEWVAPTMAPSGQRALDVLIVGAGQSGLAIAFALRREQVRHVRIIDRAPVGHEGPWVTFARMRTLRTPKHLIGPDLGIPSLTFRSWYEAQPDLPPWSEVTRIPRPLWMAYLDWYRAVLTLPVENEVELVSVAPGGPGLVAAELRRQGCNETWFAREVVFANGMEGSGAWHVPEAFADALPRPRWAHSAESIDFFALAGKRIGVLGIGAAAADNASLALERGAKRVDLFCRRPELPGVEARAWIENNGFLRHFHELDDALRWSIMRRFWLTGAPAPKWSLDRARSHPGCHLHLATVWRSLRMEDDEILVETSRGTHRFDFVIFATGLIVDLSRRPEFARLVDDVATWADRYAAPSDEACAPLAICPYLGSGYELIEKHPGAAPHLRQIRLFNWGATPSNGISAASITGMKFGVPRLVAGITRSLYFAQAREHAAQFPWNEQSTG